MFPARSLLWQAVLRGQKWLCRFLIFHQGWTKAKSHRCYQAGKVEQKVWPWPWAVLPPPSWVSGMEYFKTVPLTKRKPGVKNHQASNPSFSREPTPPVLCLEEAPGNQRAQHETTEEINPCKSFTYQDKADPGVHPSGVTASGGCSTRQWCRLGNAPPCCLHGAGGYRAEGMAITMNHCRGFLLTWLHPKPFCPHVVWLLHASLAVLSTRLLPRAQSPSYAQPPPACGPEWVTWFH